MKREPGEGTDWRLNWNLGLILCGSLPGSCCRSILIDWRGVTWTMERLLRLDNDLRLSSSLGLKSRIRWRIMSNRTWGILLMNLLSRLSHSLWVRGLDLALDLSRMVCRRGILLILHWWHLLRRLCLVLGLVLCCDLRLRRRHALLRLRMWLILNLGLLCLNLRLGL